MISSNAMPRLKTFTQFIVQWFTVVLVGWFRIALRLLRFHWLVLQNVAPLVHGFVLISLAVGIIPVFGWFRYSLSLGETETFEITTNLWYLFFLPGATALVLILYPFSKAFVIQAGLSGSMLLLYAVAYFFPAGLHYDLKLIPQPTPFYYAYAVAIVLQLALSQVLKDSGNGILAVMREQWKKKTA